MSGAGDNDMRKVRQLGSLEQEALGWVQHLTSGQATRTDAAEVRRWRSQSPLHAAAFAQASRLWRDIGPAGRNLRATGKASPALAEMRFAPRISRRAILGGGLGTAVAATAAVAAVHPPLDLWPSWMELTADYRTRAGEQRDIALPDKAAIRLNTRTSLSVDPPEGNADQIRLISGEASFATAPQSARPLVVLAAQGRIVARGARFAVRHADGGAGPSICVTCVEGEVRIEQYAEIKAIGPGQQLSYDGSKLQPAIAADMEVATAWQRGILIFRFTPLADVVEEINRYRPGKVILLNEALGRSPVSGRFRIDHMDEIFARIELAFGAKMRSLPGGIVLLG